MLFRSQATDGRRRRAKVSIDERPKVVQEAIVIRPFGAVNESPLLLGVRCEGESFEYNWTRRAFDLTGGSGAAHFTEPAASPGR